MEVDSTEPTAVIKVLPEDVVKVIAAGEVVSRPGAALKEILENSLDAGAKKVTVTAQGGGLKLLSVADDGHGIDKEDLAMVCRRHATSKLSGIEDLKTVSTFGFRGEAMASISAVARVSLITKTSQQTFGYSASYVAGELIGEPKAMAATNGTTVTVEDLFFNLPTRRNSLHNYGEEYRLISDVVARYAIRYPAVAFVCRKIGERGRSRPDVNTKPNASVLDNIRVAFGHSIAGELVPVNAEFGEVKMESLVTKACFNLKKRLFVCFINGRLVDCAVFRRAIFSTLAQFLPKDKHPFVYIKITMPQHDIDVNVHPAKSEVRFLNEQPIVDCYIEALMKHLNSESSRAFLAQTVLESSQGSGGMTFSVKEGVVIHTNQNSQTLDLDSDNFRPRSAPSSSSRPPSGKSTAPSRKGSAGSSSVNQLDTQNSSENGSRPGTPKYVGPRYKDRTDSLPSRGGMEAYVNSNDPASSAGVNLSTWRKRSEDAPPLLVSIREALEDLKSERDASLAELFKSHIFVGRADDKFALIQHQVNLLCVEIGPILRPLLYKQILTRFADLERLVLEPPIPLTRLIRVHFKRHPNIKDETNECAEKLFYHRLLLDDYFSIRISGSSPNHANLITLPFVFRGIAPDMKVLPHFFHKMATLVNWDDEKPCLVGIASHLAELFAYHWTPWNGLQESEVGASAEEDAEGDKDEQRRDWVLQHVLFKCLRTDYHPPKSLNGRNVVRQLTSLPKLYSVFERC